VFGIGKGRDSRFGADDVVVSKLCIDTENVEFCVCVSAEYFS